MSKRTKVLLIVLAILILVAGALWYLVGNGEVSADVNGTSGEKADGDVSDSFIVKIDDGVTTVNAGQTLTFSMTVNTLKLFETVSGITNPTEEQFNTWFAQNQYDKYWLNAYLGSGQSVNNDAWIVQGANFTVKLPELKYPLVEIKYAASGRAPANIDLRANKVKNIARIVRRPCHVETRLLGRQVLVCPVESKVRVAQHVDADTISFDANRTDLALDSFIVNDNDIMVGEEFGFTADYRNISALIAGGAKLKIKFKQDALVINDPAFRRGPVETIDGVKYDVYNMSLGDVMPTVNGTSRTDAATIAAIKTALQAALVGNTNTNVVKAINDAIKVVDQYAAGTKTIADLTAAVNSAKKAVDDVNNLVLSVDDSNINTIINWLTTLVADPRSVGETKAALTRALDIANQYKAGNKTKTELVAAIDALGSVPGTPMLRQYWDSLRTKARQLPERHISRGFGTATMTGVAQAVASCTSLTASVNTPAAAIRIPFTATAAPQVTPGFYRFEVFAELTTTSNDTEPVNNKRSVPIAVIVPNS